MNDRVTELASQLKAGLRGIYGQRLKGVYIYGSWARAEQQSQSDVDVLVVLDDFDSYGAEVDRASELGAELSLKNNVSVSMVFLRERDWLGEETPFLANVREEAIPA